MTPQQGLQAFEKMVRQDVTSVTVASIDWQRLLKDRLTLRHSWMKC